MSVRVRLTGHVAPGQRASLTADLVHHLRHVLRLELQTICVGVDEAGRAYRVQLVSWEPGEVLVRSLEDASEANPKAPLEVFLPILKGGRSDGLIRQLTELGATRLVPMVWERGQVRPNAEKGAKMRSRWLRISDEAGRQCERTDRVEVAAHQTTLPEGPGVFLCAREGLSPSEAWAAHSGAELRLAVGPEGGFSPAEVTALTAQGWTPLYLGPRVLRAETAVVAAVVLALHGRAGVSN